MAQIDFKNCTFRICDGRLAAVTIGTSNAALTVTDKSKHRGTRSPIRIRVVNGGANQTLTVSLAADGVSITINAATDGSSVITTTPNLAKAALEADTDINALATFTVGGTGNSAMSAVGYTATTNGARNIEVKLGEGNITFSEKKPRKYVLEKGVISDVVDDDDVPVEISFNGTWEYVTGSSGSNTPTVPDALKKIGEADDWVSTSSDPCEPYMVDLELLNNPACEGGTLAEFFMFEMFSWEELDFSPDNAQFSIKGRCKITEVPTYRQAA